MNKNKYVTAVLYLVVFLLIQYVANYLVCFAWQVAEGKSIRAALSGLNVAAAHPSVTMMIVVQAVFSIVTLLVFLWAGWCRVSRSYLRSKPWAVLSWAAIATLGTVIPSEVFLELVPLPDISSNLLVEMMGNRWGYLAICIFAPVVEELVFRGAVLRALLDGSRRHWVAIAVSAALFALVHLNPAQMPHAFCLGLLLGWMYYRTRSVIPGIMVHWVNNTLAYAVCNIFPQYADAKVIDLFGGNAMRVTLAVVFSLFIFIPAVVQLHFRLRRAE